MKTSKIVSKEPQSVKEKNSEALMLGYQYNLQVDNRTKVPIIERYEITILCDCFAIPTNTFRD